MKHPLVYRQMDKVSAIDQQSFNKGRGKENMRKIKIGNHQKNQQSFLYCSQEIHIFPYQRYKRIEKNYRVQQVSYLQKQ